MFRSILAFALAFALLPFALAADEPLTKAIDVVIDGPDYKQAHWGLLIVDAKTGDVLYQRNSEKLFTPASTTKLYSCAAAMIAYGAEHRFKTPVYTRGKIDGDGVLKGDLILVARGDLTLGGRLDKDGKLAFENSDHTYANSGQPETKLVKADPLAGLNDLAAQIAKAGVKEIAGEVLIDDRLFTTTRSSGSGPDVVSPIMINDNCLDIIIEPGEKPGDRAKVTVRPETSAVQVDAEIATVNKATTSGVNLHSDAANSIVVRGRIAVGSPPMIRIYPISDPTSFARTCFIEALKRNGIRVNAALTRPSMAHLPNKEAYEEMPMIAEYTSAPLGELLKVILKVSHNLYASTLPCLVAAKMGKHTQEEGMVEQRKILKELGVDVETISFAGGAGGAAADATTPKATVQLLQGLSKRKEWPQFQQWLPSLGVDGTLSSVVAEDSPAKGKVFAKTGTLMWGDTMNGRALLKCKALAGAMTTKSGRDLLFAMYVNDVPLPATATPVREGKVLGKLCEIVYETAK